MSGRNMPARRAMPSRRPRRRRCRPRAAVPRRARSRICWCRSTATICRSIARARFTPARVSTSTARRCAIGSDRRLGCSSRSSPGSGGTSSPPRKSTATTRLSRCWRQGLVGPRPDGCGSMCATTDRSVAKRLRPPPTSTVPTAAASIRRRTWPHSPVCSRPMAMPDSRRCTIGPQRAREPITEVACWAHCRRKFFDVWEATKSPVAKEALDRIAAIYVIEAKARFAPAAERLEHREETAPLLESFFDMGRKPPRPSCRPSRRWPRRSATPSSGARRCTRFVTDGRLEADNNIAENAMRGIALGRRTICSPVRIAAASGRHPSTPRASAKLNGINPETYLQGHPDTDRRGASHQPDRRADAVADDLNDRAPIALTGEFAVPLACPLL